MNPPVLDETRLAAIPRILQSHGTALSATGPQTWEMTGFASMSRLVTMRLRGQWLHFESAPRLPHVTRLPGLRRAHQMLCCNTSLPGCLTHCVGLRRACAMLSADFPVDRDHVDDDDLSSQVCAACDAFCDAMRRPHPRRAAGVAMALEGLQVPLCVDHEMGAATREHCDDRGWTYVERGSGQLAITLDVPDQFCQAHAYQIGETEFRLGATLEVPTELSLRSRHALEVFLLTACRLVRMARVGVVLHDGRSLYRWEVVWPRLPSSAQLHSGLAALSVACRLTGRELHALSDESIACTYLRLRGCSRQ